MSQTNPVLSRIGVLADHWARFVDEPTGRLLCWRLARADAPLALAFARVECGPEAMTPDLFFVADDPFEGCETYVEGLASAVWKAWEDDGAGLKGSGVEVDWDPPQRAPAETSVSWLVRVVVSLASARGAPWQHVVLALFPVRIGDPGVWVALLDELMSSRLPETVRVLVRDDPHDAILDDLVMRLGVSAVQQSPDLDTASLAQEIIASAGGSGPGVDFRGHMARLLAAIPAGDVEGALTASAAASGVALAQGWHALNAAVSLATSQVFVARADHERALAYLEQSFEAARSATEAGDGLGVKIEFQALSAIGGSMMLLGRPLEAAAEFMAAGMRADALGDPWHRLESWRLAAVAFLQGGDRALAWATGAHALEACAALPADQLRYSTMPWLFGLLEDLALDRSDQEREALQVVMTELRRHGAQGEVQA